MCHSDYNKCSRQFINKIINDNLFGRIEHRSYRRSLDKKISPSIHPHTKHGTFRPFGLKTVLFTRVSNIIWRIPRNDISMPREHKIRPEEIIRPKRAESRSQWYLTSVPLPPPTHGEQTNGTCDFLENFEYSWNFSQQKPMTTDTASNPNPKRDRRVPPDGVGTGFETATV